MTSAQQGSNHLGISGKSLYGSGENGKSFGVPLSGATKARMAKHSMTRMAGTIMFNPEKAPHEQHPVCWCHRGVANKSDKVAIYRQTSGQSSRMHGVTTCKSVWACPTCSAKICATRQAEVSEAMQRHIANGGYVFLMTRTFPHELHMPAAELVEKEAKARLYFRNSRAYRRGKEARTGYICSLECTIGEKHGWHPHTHELVFATPEAFGPAKEGEDGRLLSRYIDELKEAWYMALRKAGLCEQSQMSDVLAHGLDVRGGQKAAEYVAKFGRDQKWGMSRELTGHAAKVGTDNKGMHPFQLLALAELGDGWAVEKFREYAEAFQGKRMLSWSKGLKKLLLGVEDDTDEEAADRELPDEARIGYIDSESLSILHKRRLIPNFLGFVAEYCSNPETAQEEIDEFIAWARTVPIVARGDVKKRMHRGGFMHVDVEKMMEEAA